MALQTVQTCALLSMIGITLVAEGRPIEDRPQIVVTVFNDADVAEATIAGAEKTAAEIYEQAGLAMVWKNCSAKPLGEPRRCVQATGIDHLVVHIEHQPRTLAAEVYGVAFLGDDGSGVYCDVFYDRIAELHHRGRSGEARILGVVVAHELGHLLLGSHAHSPIGIMRPQLQARDFWTAELGITTFSREQARRISDRLARMRTLRHSIGSPAA